MELCTHDFLEDRVVEREDVYEFVLEEDVTP